MQVQSTDSTSKPSNSATGECACDCEQFTWQKQNSLGLCYFSGGACATATLLGFKLNRPSCPPFQAIAARDRAVGRLVSSKGSTSALAV